MRGLGKVPSASWLLYCEMHWSAASFFSNTISQITVGLAASIIQLNILPSGSMAILISSAVVPGAKFDAWTTNGPADPLIEKPEA